MMSTAVRRWRLPLTILILLVGISASAIADGLEALIIGGGPSPQDNQVAIESNVRYLLRLLPNGSPRTVLFADGDPQAKTVLFEKKAKDLAAADRILTLLLQGPEAWRPATYQFRAPTIPKIDGPAKRAGMDAAFERLRGGARGPSNPLLLYFTGHGSANKQRNLDNNAFDLWGEQLYVKDLAQQISALPPDRPLAIVMVQCYSGAFGNLLFQGGDPAADAVENDIAGFFATVKEKMAAGCTPAVDERDYKDFSTYFFAALTGKDRVGRAVTGADYNHDGRVGMDEAFCYTLVHNATIDIPVCTSDVFLRRFVTLPDSEIFKSSYEQLKDWATPAQKAALDLLSNALGITGDDRLQNAWSRFRDEEERRQRSTRLNASRRGFWVIREEERNALFARWPDLKDPASRAYAAARTDALPWVRRRVEEGKYVELLEGERKLMDEERAAYERELSDARLVRFVRLAKSIVLAHTLRTAADESVKRRFEKLVTAEQRSLLPWQGAPARAAQHR